MPRIWVITLNTLFVLLCVVGLTGCTTVQPPSTMATIAPRATPFSPENPLTLEVAIRQAHQHDPELRVARHNVSVAYWEKVQTSLPPNPRLSLIADPTEWVVKLATHIVDMIDPVNRRQSLIHASETREEVAVLDLQTRQIALTKNVRVNFSEVYIRQKATSLLQERVELFRELVDIANKQLALGALSRLDVLRLERELFEAQMQLSEQMLLCRQANARLNRLLNLPLATESVLDMPEEEAAWVSFELNENNQMDLGMLQRPELTRLAVQARELEILLKVAPLQWLGDVESGVYFKNEDSTEIGIELLMFVPVFDRGEVQKRVYEAKLAALEEQMLATQASLILEVHEAALQLLYVRQRLYDELPAIYQLLLTEHDLLQQAQYLGEADAVAVRKARIEMLDAEMASEMARLAVFQSQADLAAALGDRGLDLIDSIS